MAKISDSTILSGVKESPNALIKRWREAFVSANGRQPEEPPYYDDGWFKFASKLHPTRSVRAKELDAMAKRLEIRAAFSLANPNSNTGGK